MVYVFDAYGTLWDLTPIQAAAVDVAGVSVSGEFLDLWRRKQLEYAFLRTIMDHYEPFSRVTADALEYVLSAYQLTPSEEEKAALLDAWNCPAAFADAIETLGQLEGHQRVILSNGDLDMLRRGVEYSALTPYLDGVFSVDSVQRFKPHPAAYQVILDALNVPLGEVVFVSANGWDAAGAAKFGFRVIWINRAHLPVERLSVVPWKVVSSLREAAEG